MAEYTPGTDEDHVVKTEAVSEDLDLTKYIAWFRRIKSGLQQVPAIKISPDQETLECWLAEVYVPGQDQKATLDAQAVELYNSIKPVKDAGLLPSKYDDEYQQLENYINSL